MIGTILKGALGVGKIGVGAVGVGIRGLTSKGMRQAGSSIMSGAASAASFAYKHPYATMGIIGGGALAINAPDAIASLGRGQTGISPTLEGVSVNTNYNQQAIAAQELMAGSISPMGGAGTFPQYQQLQQRRQAMQNSTQGLVQGLHRGRHR